MLYFSNVFKCFPFFLWFHKFYSISYTPVRASPAEYVFRVSLIAIIILKEHIQVIKNDSYSGYLKHILSRGHAYGNKTNNIDIIKAEKKKTNILERYHM